MENNIIFRPAKRYLIKLYLSNLYAGIVTISVWVLALFAIKQNEVSVLPLFIIGCVMIVIQIIISSVITASHHSILYEITNDAIIAHSGIITRNKEHIPFRAITNIATRQDIIDRFLKIGTLEIHTAGTGVVEPEIELHGLENLEAVYKLVAQKLKNTSYNSSH